MALDMDPHILNFYEDLELPLSEIPQLISTVLRGEVKNPKEKLDGQNFSFVIDEKFNVRFMGKGCAKWIRELGGLNREMLKEHYSDRPQVQRAFISAYDAIQSRVAKCDKELLRTFSGHVMSVEVVSNINPNLVRYKKNYICIIGMQPMGSKFSVSNQTEMQLKLQDHLCDIDVNDGWSIIKVPFVEFKPNVCIEDNIHALTLEFNALVPSEQNVMTMGDLLTHYVSNSIKNVVVTDECTLRLAAKRLVYDDSSIITNKQFNPSTWKAFKRLDDERARVVGDAIIPVESFFRKFGALAIDLYEFKLADTDDKDQLNTLKTFVADVQTALKEQRVVASSDVILTRIKSASNRVDPALYNKNVEGFVFEWKGKLRKITGAFTALNRLHGYFFFENAATIKQPSQ